MCVCVLVIGCPWLFRCIRVIYLHPVLFTDFTSPDVNLALRRRTWQSSTYDSGKTSLKAVDGRRKTHGSFCAHTRGNVHELIVRYLFTYIIIWVLTIINKDVQTWVCHVTTSRGNIFRVTGPLCGESTGHRWMPLTKASDADLLVFYLICAWTNSWANNRDAGDLRRHRAHRVVTVMALYLQCNTM